MNQTDRIMTIISLITLAGFLFGLFTLLAQGDLFI